MNLIKSMDKKYVIILSTIVGILLVMFIFIFIMSIFNSKDRYRKAEKKLVSAAEQYLKENGMPDIGTTSLISDETLSNMGYMKELKHYTKEACTGEVTVANNGGEYLYLPSISCGDYKTKTISDTIIAEQLVTEKDGLYKDNEEYIFKGKNVNNYLSFSKSVWRIVKIDKDGNLRLIKATPEDGFMLWDNKYNSSTKTASGVNDYETSLIRETLENSYKELKGSFKKHLQAHSVCIGKRDRHNLVIDNNLDCGQTLSNQYISLINLSDYLNASLDPECTSITAGNCRNYNYIYQFLDETWTSNAITDNNYEAIKYSAGQFSAVSANTNSKYYKVIYINGDELYKTGDGTKKNPYQIN